MTNLNTAIRDELLHLPIVDPAVELSGFFDALQPIATGGGVCLSSPRLTMMRRLLKLWRGLNDTAINATMRLEEAHASVGLASCDTMRDCGKVLELDKKRGRAVLRLRTDRYEAIRAVARALSKSQRWTWFRGVWGATGSLYLPQNGYYMSLRMIDRRDATERLAQTLSTVGIVPGRRKTGNRVEFTVRDQDQIVTCLAGMGIVKSTLFLEETAIVRSLRNRANKVVNCDSANIGKTVHAAREQMALVDRIDDEGLWNGLPPPLAELARLRRTNPSASLRELGQMMEKPVSKSTVEYRWRRLETFINGTE